MIQHDPAIHHDLPQSQHDLTIYYFPISRLFDLDYFHLLGRTVISLLSEDGCDIRGLCQ